MRAPPAAWLPLPKAAYFLFFGAMAFVVPFLSVFLRERCGLRAREIGLLMGGTRVVQSLAAPLWTLAADRRAARRRAILSGAWLGMFE